MQVQIDYTTVEPLPHRKTIAYVNNFVINTTQFLNRFSYLCEQKLSDVAASIQRLEITMQLLEVKLGSIPGLEGVAPVAAAAPAAPAAPGAPAGNVPVVTSGVPPPPPPPGSGAPPPPPPPGVPAPPAPPAPPVAVAVAEEAPASTPGVMTNKEDPRYTKYFKMLSLGIPMPSIQQKMMMEGISPDVLDNPDAPSGGGDAQSDEKPGKSGRDQDDFGDDDDDDDDDDFD